MMDNEAVRKALSEELLHAYEQGYQSGQEDAKREMSAKVHNALDSAIADAVRMEATGADVLYGIGNLVREINNGVAQFLVEVEAILPKPEEPPTYAAEYRMAKAGEEAGDADNR